MAETGTPSTHHDAPSSSQNHHTNAPNRRRRYRRPQSSKIAAHDKPPESEGIPEAPLGEGSTLPEANHGHNAGQPSSRNGGAGRRRKPRVQSDRVEKADTTINADTAAPGSVPPPNGGPRRKANFGATLTKPDEGERLNPSIKQAEQRSGKGKQRLPQDEDLTSRLIRELSTPPFSDCPICFSSIRPEQPIWACSPSIPIVVSNDAQIREYCWTSFHLKCIRSWAERSVKEVADSWRARGELNKKGDWRCPGCQAKREITPSSYWCFCNSTAEPKRARLSTPHSCGSSCSRPRESGCGHPCILRCHPGPCPPCKVMTRSTCYCPHQQIFTFHCGTDGRSKLKGPRNLSCGNICGRPLNCGKHTCGRVCHDGPCDSCDVMELARCWCGKGENQVRCGEDEEVQCFVEGESPWIGRFGCGKICERPFECGKHTCGKLCHPPSSKPAVCPHSPSKVERCPCGKQSIAPNPSSEPSQYTFAARIDCSDPIPTCDSVCSKAHLACGHPCLATCHNEPCPPCSEEIIRPCRCGGTTRSLPCYAVHSESTSEESEILCEKPCLALRACGKHECRRICCPLASLSTSTRKGKKRVPVNENIGVGEEQGGLHECDVICGKALSCGNHKCELKDHKGPCRPCLRSSFEELICACERTVYEPPIPCGTRMECHYPCPRPRTTCEHKNTPHSCHDDDTPCPPCVHLTEKMCACGKKLVQNVRCSLETDKLSCGSACGKLMSCGFHRCERLCHNGACGACNALCGKPRKSCLPNTHPCVLPCHAPSACSETEPCKALLTLTCPCGRAKQAVYCGRTESNPTRLTQSGPKCTNDCLIAKRNARLAEALGINTEERGKAHDVVYSDELLAFARADGKFLMRVEKFFAEFVASEKRVQILPHMPPEKRKFVRDLAGVYRMDTQMIDQEPYRSVQILRRLDTRIPVPPISAYVANTAPPPSLGKLVDLRAPRGPSVVSPFGVGVGGASIASTVRSSSPSNSNAWRVSSAAQPLSSGRSTTPVGGQREWAAVVKPPATGLAEGKPSSSMPLGSEKPRLPGPAIAGSMLGSAKAETLTSQGSIPNDWEEDA